MDNAEPTKFMSWLAEHQDEVEGGAASFEGIMVTRNSTVTRYFCCTSFLFFMARQISGCVLEGSPEANKVRLRCTLVTMIFGCLGFGIFIVPMYLYKNLMGGYRLTVADLLDNTDKVQKSVDNFEFGPAQVIFIVLGLVAILAVALQIAIYCKKHTGH